VKYCSRDCQIAHRPQHENECNKRAAELHDEDEALFRQPPKADYCPICFLLLPSMGSEKAIRACCGKAICSGCFYEHKRRNNGRPTCPFCRAELPSAKECTAMLEKRVDANDAEAICELGHLYLDGVEPRSIKKDIYKAVE
jgi:hypothetical protein